MNALQFRVYQCKAGHFHILTDPVVPSWPFWSLGVGLQLIDFCIQHFVDLGSPDAEHERRSFEALKQELECLSRTQLRDSSGRFSKGFRLPRQRPRLNEYSVATWWPAFFGGQGKNVYVYHDLLMREIPLRCDFIARPGDDLPLTLYQLERLSASSRTVEEVDKGRK